MENILKKQKEFFKSGKTLAVNYRINVLKKLKQSKLPPQNQSFFPLLFAM